MNEQSNSNIASTSQPEATPASTAKSKNPSPKKSRKKLSKTQKSTEDKNLSQAKPTHNTAKNIIYAILLLVFLGLVCTVTIIALIATREPEDEKQIDHVEYPDPIYSILTGEEISDNALNSSPTFCVQIPNGKDGARPQAGLNQAAVVFEAIAEAGITRFAAIFQNATASAIGPIRSLRPYYLEWDLPFDCTIVHAGGSDEAMTALRHTGAHNLNENYDYMWREQGGERMWNNLFTSSSSLLRYTTEMGWNSSNVKAFARFTPEENEQILAKNSACPEAKACETALATNIYINFSGIPIYNTVYQYDTENNRYLRSYANGEAHLIYACPENLNQPRTITDCGEPVQVAPKVVIAMFVQENKMPDNYHENIVTTGQGDAVIFQNGEVIEGTWQKTSAGEQITFRDSTGNLIKLAPGQTWISAVPIYTGSVDWN